MDKPELPYLPLGWEVHYVDEENKWMKEARLSAGTLSTDAKHPTGAVLVKDNELIGRGANCSNFHKHIGCVRKFLRKFFPVPSGKMYWTCRGCSPRFHAEQMAIRSVKKKKLTTKGADLYLWGHWWCCQSCWDKILDAEIKRVYLVKEAKDKFRQK